MLFISSLLRSEHVVCLTTVVAVCCFSQSASALCALPEFQNVCQVAPLGDTCFVGVLDSRDEATFTATVSDVFGENPAGVGSGGSIALVIDEVYEPAGYTGGLAEPGAPVVFCSVGELLTYDHHLAPDGRLELDFSTPVDGEDAAFAFLDTEDCVELFPPATCGNGSSGCSSAGNQAAIWTFVCLCALLRRRRLKPPLRRRPPN